MSNWIGQKDAGPWLAGLSSWNLIKLKSRSCWTWFISGAWGCGGAGPRFKITWFLTEFSCLWIQDWGAFSCQTSGGSHVYRSKAALSSLPCDSHSQRQFTKWPFVFFPVPAGLFLPDFSFNSSQLQESYLTECDPRSDYPTTICLIS